MARTWWKEAVIYQIYPRSFKDSNGDGIGDLRGIIEKLDYLKELGIDVLWLSPVYRSPNDDNGYDISDYRAIMEEFGSMSDFDALLEGAHARGLKLVMDLVVNHSSDEHPWFQESRSSKHNPYRDYYFWEPEPPNNWKAFFGGSAWQYDEPTGEYYLHLFSRKQPDLNWENRKVREEVYSLMRFWLDKGIDGFRMDVIPFISKRMDWPDMDPQDFSSAIEQIYANGPRLHEFLREMNRKVLSKYDIVTVGEAPGVPPKWANLYVGDDREELNMIFHFGHMMLDWGPGGKFDSKGWGLNEFKEVFNTWHRAVGQKGWISIFLDNHDFPRLVSRWGNDGKYRVESAKLLATLLLTMRGTPSIYQGTEIGMTNVSFESIEDYRDLETVNEYRDARERGDDLDALLGVIHRVGRDNVRTPIQWDGRPNAGFTAAAEPWIKVNPNYREINVEAALADPDSIFYYYRKLLRLRKENLALVYGDYEPVDEGSDWLFAYRRWSREGEFYVYLNFSSEEQSGLALPTGIRTRQVISNYNQDASFKDTLRPWEARVYEVVR